MWGSGFLVAPGWVVTCAHVLLGRIGEEGGAEFLVRGPGLNGGHPVAALMERTLYRGPMGEAPGDGESLPMEQDVALVRLLAPSVEHECVWLSDQSLHPLTDVRVVYGYRPDGPGRTLNWNGVARVNARDGDYGLRLAPDNEFPEGVSGGPVLDPAMGAVVALIKCRRGVRDGGLSVAIPVLRGFGDLYDRVITEHDRWHRRRGRQPGDWISLQGGSAGLAAADSSLYRDRWSHEDRRIALGLLADVEPADAPRTVSLLVARARGKVPSLRAHPPVGWRDGQGQLCEDERIQEAYVHLHYLRLVQLFLEHRGGGDAEAVARLREWIDERRDWIKPAAHMTVDETSLPAELADERPVVTYPEPGDGGVVSLELEALDDDMTRVFWTLRVDDGSEDADVPFDGESRSGTELQRLCSALEGPLAAAFRIVDRPGRLAPLEVAMDLRHFDTPVHEWQVLGPAHAWDHARRQLLGIHRPVVIRDLERRGLPAESWNARWSAMLASRKLTAKGTVFNGSILGAEQFADLPGGTIPVQCRPAATGHGHTAMRLALETGHGVLLWHLQHYGEGPGEECGIHCTKLHRATARFLAEVGHPTELPDRIRRIREDSRAGAERHWADTVAVLYDDPRRPLPVEDGVFDSP
ncbi:trypsin-like peptidase domain-containing protein [Streptomyces sp. MBT33]|uniref:VMAP-C domain-containing protein n=1 Tax=Streptomyces sp. MBT33 TaxID=1488363 RepID=UPI001F47C756|nr:trypsin-like peptidase domain-containing protein [Streptomyces sp. MBT33]